MLTLALLINEHRDLYYRRAGPRITDREYDALFDELLALEKKYPELAAADSPTARVGSDLDNTFPEVSHPFPMLSLDKVYSSEDLGKWIDKVTRDADGDVSFVVEEKVDGSTIVLHFEDGVLTRAVTRGDGYVGNDITRNVGTIDDIPLRLTEAVTGVFRGEIYLDIADFKKLNAEMDNIYANPRNFAAGTLRRKKSREVARVPLRSYVYEGFSEREEGLEHIEVLDRISKLGFRVGGSVGFFSDSLPGSRYDPLFEAHEGWERGTLDEIIPFIERRRSGRDKLGYEIDGLVVKVNQYGLRDSMGFTAHHPRWAIAFKFEAPQAVSTIEDIEVQIGRTGRATPVARIRPVWISGSTVSNVTLHNEDYITALGASIGDTVSISRRGDVIPAVEEVVEKKPGGTAFVMPELCPSCSTPLVRDGAHHFCKNRSCPARVFGRIAFFTARGQMDIENLGWETVRRLLDLGLIHDISDIYGFNPDDLLDREGFGEKKVSLIKEGIEKSKNRPFSVVLTSLGLEEIGPRVVQLLIDAGYDSIDRLTEAARKGDVESLTGIDGIGPKTADRIVEQLSDPDVMEMIDRLREAGLQFAEREKGPLPEPVFAGQTWCVTGSFDNFKPRERAMDEVRKRGGRVTSAVTGKTTHLLAGMNPGSKLEKARDLGTEVVGEEDFLSMLGGYETR